MRLRGERSPDGAPPGAPSAPRLVGDNARHLSSAVVTIAALLVSTVTIGLPDPDADGFLLRVVTLYFGAWTLYCSGYCLLTAVVLGRVDGATLASWLAESADVRRRRRMSELLVGGGGTTGAITLGVLALVAVAVAVAIPVLQTNPWVIALATAVVVSTWLMIVSVYAVHYAREATNVGGLEIEGARRPRFGEFWFLAMHAQTSLSVSGARVTTSAMRRSVAAHSAVAYLFSTVIVALLVSLIAVSRP